jgi:hypothetical protein
MVQINSAEANRASLRYIKEQTNLWGTTPGNGVTREMRITSSSITASKETAVSEEIRADRMIPSIAEVGASSGGEVNWELSAFTHDDFWEAALLSTWTLPMNGLIVKGSSVSVTGVAEITLAGIDWTDQIETGQWLKLEGFNNAENNTYVEVFNVAFTAGNTVITVSEGILVVEAGNAYSKLVDANDVLAFSDAIVLSASNVLTAPAGTFTGKKLYAGQKIYIEGLGKGTGTITVEATNPTAGSTFQISDGADTLIFEFQTTAEGVNPGNVFVAMSDTEATQAGYIATAINEQFKLGRLRVTAEAAAAVVTLTNHRGDGGAITESLDSITAVTFSGGSATKSGFYTIAVPPQAPDYETITVAETLTADANSGGLPVLVKGSHLRNSGVLSEIIKRSFTIETGFTDVGKYFRSNGLRVASFEMNVETGSIVTGTFTFMGRETVNSNFSLLSDTGTYTVLPTTATEILNATANVGQVSKNGAQLATALRSISLSGDNNCREQPAVGEKFPAGIAYGRFMLTGNITAYFETFDFYTTFIQHETISLGFDFEDVDHNKYFFTVPAVKITTDPIAPSGIDTDVEEEMEWQALRDPVLNTQFMIDRFSSVYPFTAALTEEP